MVSFTRKKWRKLAASLAKHSLAIDAFGRLAGRTVEANTLYGPATDFDRYKDEVDVSIVDCHRSGKMLAIVDLQQLVGLLETELLWNERNAQKEN
jgi:hypothetical protein